MKRTYLLLLFFTILFAACSDDNENDLTKSISINCKINYEDTNQNILVDANAKIFIFGDLVLADVAEYKENGSVILKNGSEIKSNYSGLINENGLLTISNIETRQNYTIYIESNGLKGLIKGIEITTLNKDVLEVTHTFDYKDFIITKLKGKKWAGCGDSITEAFNKDGHVPTDPVTGENTGYVEIIGKRNQMEYHNYGVGGGYLSYKPNHYYCFSNSDETAKYRKPTYKQLPDELDYITIWFGINDSWYSGLQNDKNIGTINSTENTTFYGAYNVVLDYLIKKYPNAKIGIIVTHGTTVAYRKAIRDISKKWDIACLDLIAGNNPIWISKEPDSPFDQSVLDERKVQFTYDGQHPNKAGYEYLAPIIERWLCTL